MNIAQRADDIDCLRLLVVANPRRQWDSVDDHL
jgi:hypothetical protein